MNLGMLVKIRRLLPLLGLVTALAGPSLWADEEAILKGIAEKIGDGAAGSLLFYSQAERDVAFKNITHLLPTRPISTGPYTHPMPAAHRNFDDLRYTVQGKSYSVADYLGRAEARGLLVWQDGNVLFEAYANGNNAESLWVSFSVAKSVTSMLIGAAIKDGYIKSVDDPVTDYVARFCGTGYEGTTVSDVLQMSSGLKWNEDYADPNSDVSNAVSWVVVA